MDTIKSIIASFCLMLGLLLGVSASVGDERKVDWIMWALFFLIGALVVWFWIMREQRTAEELAEDALDAAEGIKRKVEIKSSPEPAAQQEATPAQKAEVPPSVPMPVLKPDVPASVPVPVPVESDEPDDLTRIEGIGPKMADILVAAGIDSYTKLAAMSEDAIAETIKAGGGRKSASIGTWAQQAKLAAKGDWNGLAKLQTKLKRD